MFFVVVKTTGNILTKPKNKTFFFQKQNLSKIENDRQFEYLSFNLSFLCFYRK